MAATRSLRIRLDYTILETDIDMIRLAHNINGLVWLGLDAFNPKKGLIKAGARIRIHEVQKKTPKETAKKTPRKPSIASRSRKAMREAGL